MDLDITDLRRNYTRDGLMEADADPNPFAQFRAWFHQALNAQLHEPNAMMLTTVSAQMQPSSRVVLLKGVDEHGFVFYTNYGSKKAKDIEQNPHVSLLFWWDVLERQVRIEGTASKISREESEAYFRTRPVGSQLGAWTSQQSSVIAGREVLERTLREYQQQFADQEIPCPPFWGGFRIVPRVIEFWQGRPSRLHDRLRYSLESDGHWIRERLSP